VDETCDEWVSCTPLEQAWNPDGGWEDDAELLMDQCMSKEEIQKKNVGSYESNT